MEKTMKNSEYIKDLLNRMETTDSKKEEKELEFIICKWCYDMIKSICKCEKTIEGLDWSISFSKEHYDNGAPKYAYEYRCDEDMDDVGNLGLYIIHEYASNGEVYSDDLFLPYYVIDDIEGGLQKYYHKKIEEQQGSLRKSIIYDLRCIKSNIKRLNYIPEDLKEILDNDFWNLI